MDWANGAVYMDLSMKDMTEYGQPSTREALTLMQRYVFHELQMHRLSLPVPAYNKNLLTLMPELGFMEEVRSCEILYRFGRRWDKIHFGILASEWGRSKL
ncbi:MAG: GNAT family N-acetyltransferase [Anaerolineales bacterium]|nr:GNAT family N-acetyltransferase [Anaerolineales bacterium]